MGEVMDKSHDAAYMMIDENQIISIESIVSQFENGDLIMEYLNRCKNRPGQKSYERMLSSHLQNLCTAQGTDNFSEQIRL